MSISQLIIWSRQKIKTLFNLYDIEDLRIGGCCGCCGKWIPDKIFDKNWPWCLCKKHEETTNN